MREEISRKSALALFFLVIGLLRLQKPDKRRTLFSRHSPGSVKTRLLLPKKLQIYPQEGSVGGTELAGMAGLDWFGTKRN